MSLNWSFGRGIATFKDLTRAAEAQYGVSLHIFVFHPWIDDPSRNRCSPSSLSCGTSTCPLLVVTTKYVLPYRVVSHILGSWRSCGGDRHTWARSVHHASLLNAPGPEELVVVVCRTQLESCGRVLRKTATGINMCLRANMWSSLSLLPQWLQTMEC